MAPDTAETHIETLILSAFNEGRCGDFYIVDLVISGGSQIAVYVDGDEGLNLEQCKQISRTLEAILDEEPSLGGHYSLEISSPGVTRPLKFLRQYRKHIGRMLDIRLADGNKAEGILKECLPNGISIEMPSKEHKGDPVEREIPFEEIQETMVKVQFGKIKKEKREKKTKKKKKK